MNDVIKLNTVYVHVCDPNVRILSSDPKLWTREEFYGCYIGENGEILKWDYAYRSAFKIYWEPRKEPELKVLL
jgi:hypothetical protein